MSQTTIMFLQSMLAALQVVNAGIASVTHSALVALLLGAVVMGIQVFVQAMGNKTVSPELEAAIRKDERGALPKVNSELTAEL